MKKITLFTLLTLIATVGFCQYDVQNFESATSDDFPVASTIVAEVVANPFPDDKNSSDNCLKLTSTGSHPWWALVRFPIDPAVTISAAETKFLSVMVNFPAQPDLIVRFDGNETAPNGTNAGTIRALNEYDSSAPNTWQQIVFEIKDGQNDFAYTLGSLDRIVFHPDGQDENEPRGRVLVGDVAGYVDNVQILDENPLATASVKGANFEDAFSIYPSTVSSIFTIKTTKTINNISIFNVLGKNITNSIVELGKKKYNISSLSSGMYIVKITSENGSFITKKIIKE